MISLPADAVLRKDGMSVAWVETSRNTFKSRMVETGRVGDEKWRQSYGWYE